MQAVILSLSLVAAVGCSPSGSGKKKIVCTIFPQYDWIKEILGDNADDFELVLLTDTGVDLHSYQPSFSDVAKIASSDLFVYVGGTSDGWVESTLNDYPSDTRFNVCMIDFVDALEEEEVEGDEKHDHEHDHEQTEYDEHV